MTRTSLATALAFWMILAGAADQAHSQIQTTTIHPSADNLVMSTSQGGSIDQTAYPAAELSVGCNQPGQWTWICAASLLRFDLPNISVGQLESATLELDVMTLPGSPAVYELLALVSAWSPSSVTGSTQVQWYDASRQLINAPQNPGTLRIDVTEIVRAWLSGSWPNQGVILRDTAREIYAYRATGFFSMEAFNSPTQRPRLRIAYDSTPVQPVSIDDFTVEIENGSCFDLTHRVKWSTTGATGCALEASTPLLVEFFNGFNGQRSIPVKPLSPSDDQYKLTCVGADGSSVTATASPSIAVGCSHMLGNDSDRDGTEDSVDNCPFTSNSGQQDFNRDGVGDACQCGDLDVSGSYTSVDRARIASCIAGDPQGTRWPCSGWIHRGDLNLSGEFDEGDLIAIDVAIADGGIAPGLRCRASCEDDPAGCYGLWNSQKDASSGSCVSIDVTGKVDVGNGKSDLRGKMAVAPNATGLGGKAPATTSGLQRRLAVAPNATGHAGTAVSSGHTPIRPVGGSPTMMRCSSHGKSTNPGGTPAGSGGGASIADGKPGLDASNSSVAPEAKKAKKKKVRKKKKGRKKKGQAKKRKGKKKRWKKGKKRR